MDEMVSGENFGEVSSVDLDLSYRGDERQVAAYLRRGIPYPAKRTPE